MILPISIHQNPVGKSICDIHIAKIKRTALDKMLEYSLPIRLIPVFDEFFKVLDRDVNCVSAPEINCAKLTVRKTVNKHAVGVVEDE